MDGNNNKKYTLAVKDIALMAMLTALIFVQEEALTFIPNVQLTVFLLVLYSKKLGFTKTSIILALHVILDNLVMGSFNTLYTPFMFIGWLFIPTIICLFFRKIENSAILGCVGILCSLLYSWTFMIPSCLVYHMDFIKYLIQDIPFEIILSICSFVTILILYPPCSKIFSRFFNKENLN